jgi:hypothetical protein
MAKHRGSLGLMEAAMLLVVVAGALWMTAPIPRSRRAAEDERAVHAVIGAVADALDARMAGPRGRPPVRLERLLREEPALARTLEAFRPSGTQGVLGNGTYWVAVLLPGIEGLLASPGKEDPAEAMRGFCVVAWPCAGTHPALREIAALPDGHMWQRIDGMGKSLDPARPPLPRAAFPPAGTDGSRVPDPPPDWTLAKRRR